MIYKAIVKYALSDDDAAKRGALLDGIRDCAAELVELGVPTGRIVDELEQVANDVEAGELL